MRQYVLSVNAPVSDAKQKKHVGYFNKKPFFFRKPLSKKNVLNVFFYNLKKGKYILILRSAYSVIHVIYYIIQAVKHYIYCIYIDSDSVILITL